MNARKGPAHSRAFELHFLCHLDYVAGLRTFLAFNDLKLHLVTLLKALVTFAADGAVMNKDIRTIIASDESKPLGIVEPFYGSFETRH